MWGNMSGQSLQDVYESTHGNNMNKVFRSRKSHEVV